MEQVSIVTGVTGPENPEQANQPLAAQPDQQPQAERPAWLPEGFESPEQLAEAYKAMSEAQQHNDRDQQMTAEEVAADEKLNKFSSEFFEKGGLSPDSYKELAKMGYPRSVVDQFIEGQKARMAMEEQQIFSEIGGKEQYNAMVEWAGRNMKQTEIDAYNRAVESGDLNSAMFAVKGLQARFRAASGAAEPRLMQGGKSSPDGFESVAQVVAAIGDPRYKIDPAYRAQVERKIANSNAL